MRAKDSPYKGRVSYPAWMSSAATCGKHSGGKPNSVPGLAEKCSASARNLCSTSPRNGVRNHPGILFGFSPESCSPSARNMVRVAPEYAARPSSAVPLKLSCRTSAKTTTRLIWPPRPTRISWVAYGIDVQLARDFHGFFGVVIERGVKGWIVSLRNQDARAANPSFR